jgi:hypothetical protein
MRTAAGPAGRILYFPVMPNLHVTGLSVAEAAVFSRAVSAFFARELGFQPEQVYVYRREALVFRNGEAVAEPPTVVQLSWLRQSRQRFVAAVAGLTRILREDLGRTGSVQIELHEKWDDAANNGELMSDWAARMGRG